MGANSSAQAASSVFSEGKLCEQCAPSRLRAFCFPKDFGSPCTIKASHATASRLPPVRSRRLKPQRLKTAPRHIRSCTVRGTHAWRSAASSDDGCQAPGSRPARDWNFFWLPQPVPHPHAAHLAGRAVRAAGCQLPYLLLSLLLLNEV